MPLHHSYDVHPCLPWAATAAAVAYGVYVTLKIRKAQGPGSETINPAVQKENPKVVDSFDIEDLGKQTVYCRCWRSAKFPYCDGSHNKHNETTGDNIGPLIVKRRD